MYKGRCGANDSFHDPFKEILIKNGIINTITIETGGYDD
jgi:hypothetical protein